jgi:hypothetical protein
VRTCLKRLTNQTYKQKQRKGGREGEKKEGKRERAREGDKEEERCLASL